MKVQFEKFNSICRKDIENKNNPLKIYVRKLEKQAQVVKELPIAELKTKQARNWKLKELKTRAQKPFIYKLSNYLIVAKKYKHHATPSDLQHD